MKRRFLAISALLLPATLVFAQAERLTVRMTPAPNQTLHVRTSMDMTMTMTPDPSADTARSIPPMTSSMTTTAEHTTTVGPTDEHGHYGARVVCDSASHTATLNGKPAPIPSGATDRLIGQVVTFSYDDQGKMLDVATEGGGLDPALAGSLKQMLTAALAAAPPITLSVGESVTVPTQVNVPIPSAAGTLSNSGETRYTLRSVTFDGADRIAHLAMATNSAINHSMAAAGAIAAVTSDMRTVSEGTMDVNVDRGIVLHSETRTTLDGSTHVEGGQIAVPPMRIHGTMTMSADLTK